MTEAQDNSQPAGDLPAVSGSASDAVAPARGDMTVAEMREWLRNWVANATGQPADSINESAPVVELGLSSRDAVAMASDIEDLTGVTLTATVVFRNPTIEALATVIVEGEPEPVVDSDEDWTREPGVEDIAIVGLATRFPGEMNSAEAMWAALLEGRDASSDLPEGRWSEFLGEPRIAERVAKAHTRGGYLSDIKGFDSEFFALSKMEADNIDPQQRMALELTWEALEHARIPASSLRGGDVGVYVGSSNNDYMFLAVADPTTAHPYAITGTTSSIIANRVSYFYDFRGPSESIDTACSSSLGAAHQGVRALRSGEIDVAIVGGVNAMVTPLVTIGFDEVGGVLAPDGRCKSFSSDANGYAAPRVAACWCSSGFPMRAATVTRSSPSSQAARSTTTAGPTACWHPTRTPRKPCCARPTRTPGSTRAMSTTSRRTAPAPSWVIPSRQMPSAGSWVAAVPTTSPRYSAR